MTMPNKKAKDNLVDKLTPQERELLKQAQDITEIINSPGWNHIVNFIQTSIVWPDPKTYSTREEVIVPYTEAYGAADLAKKIVYFVNSQEGVIKSLTDKVDNENELPSYEIGL